MNRRGHMSHKIPNVKLRPVPSTNTANAASTSASSRSRYRTTGRDPLNAMDEELIRRLGEDAEDEDDSTRALRGTSEKPWKGVVITFTGVENKPSLTELAKELGATVENALTVHVTHVVASGFGSPKYLYAVEHRLLVMAPSWISSAHERWLNGDELDVEGDIEEFRLQPFLGLKIALSGIEPLERRRALVQYITQFGGIHSKDLDRECTHLVSSKPTFDPRPSEKVKWAVREIAVREAGRRAGKKMVDDDEGIKIVYEQWIWDCVGFNGRWKEDNYDASKARRAGKVIVDDVLSGKVFEKEEKKVEEAQEEEKAEPAVLNKRKRPAMDSLVSHLILTTAVKVEQDAKAEVTGDLQMAPVPEVDVPAELAAESRKPDIVDERLKQEQERKPSMLHVSRHTSFASPLPSAGPSRPSPLHPDPSLPSTAIPPPPSSRAAPAPSPMFYAGLRFSHAIQEQCEGLERALTSHGGELVSERDRLDGAKVDYVVIRLCASTIPRIPEGSKARIVTECWVEGCCFEQRLMDASEHLVFQPITAEMPVAGAEKLSIHLSGFVTEQTVYLKRLIRLIGASLSHSFNRRTTHLVCFKPEGVKYNKSFEWKIPALQDTWLLTIGRTGSIPPIDEYRVPGPSAAQRDLRRLTATGSTGNMSAVSDLNEPIDFGRIGQEVVVPSTKSSGQPISPRAPKSSAPPSQHSVASSRKLGLTPTHVDDILSAVDSGTKRSMDILSPPKATGTERLLNRASIPVVQVESIESRISRTNSAPAGQESLKVDKGDVGVGRTLKAATASGIGGEGAESLGKKGMTDILKRLAEEGHGDAAPANRSKVQRRPRQISKVKSIQANPYSPMNTSVSPSSKFSSPPPQQHHFESPQRPEAVEESMQVNFVDPTSIRETKWLRDALKRGGDAAMAGDGSSVKRSRVAR